MKMIDNVGTWASVGWAELLPTDKLLLPHSNAYQTTWCPLANEDIKGAV